MQKAMSTNAATINAVLGFSANAVRTVAESGGRFDMSGFLRVPPEQMHQSAAKLHEIARNLKDQHEQAHGAVSDLLAGFGENTRSALTVRLEQWEEETASHHQHLTTHAENHTRIANEFVEADDLNAKATGKIVGNQ